MSIIYAWPFTFNLNDGGNLELSLKFVWPDGLPLLQESVIEVYRLFILCPETYSCKMMLEAISYLGHHLEWITSLV